MSYRLASRREKFVARWKKEFGCKDEGVCWCNVVIKLGFVYDDITLELSKVIEDLGSSSRIEPNTIGWENLPRFMDYRKEEK